MVKQIKAKIIRRNVVKQNIQVVQKKILKLYGKLLSATSHPFPKERKPIEAPPKKGVYIIFDTKNKTKALHVGNASAKGGIRQGLQYHMSGDSLFALYHFHGNGKQLRKGYTFKYIEEDSEINRAYLQAYAIVNQWPKYIDCR